MKHIKRKPKQSATIQQKDHTKKMIDQNRIITTLLKDSLKNR